MTNKTDKFLRVFLPPFFPSVNTNCTRYPTLYPNKYCPYPGLMIEILMIIAKDAGLTLVPKTPDDFKEAYEKMNITDIFSMMKNGSLDTMGVALQKTEKREQTLDFTEYLYMTNTRLLRRVKDRKLEQIWSFFQTYDSSTWYALLFAWILQWIFCILVRRFEAHTTRNKPTSLTDCAWSILRLQLLQPEAVRFHSTSGNFAMCIFSLFQCSILLGVFSSFILASIITKKFESEDPMSEMIRLIASRQYYMITNDPFKWFFEKIKTSNAYPYSELRNALDKNELRVTFSRSEALSQVSTGNAILFQQVDEGSFFEAMAHCEILVLEQNMPMVEAHLALRKNHPLMGLLNETIRRNRHRFLGLAAKYYQKALQSDQCPEMRGYRALTINPFLGLIFTCLIIVSIASLILCLEILAGKIRRPLNQLERVIEQRKQITSSSF